MMANKRTLATSPVTTPLFVAIDTPSKDAAVEISKKLAQSSGLGLKLGLEFFGALGPDGVRAVKEAAPKTPIFLDLKFHDIPNTVAGVIKSIAPLAPAMLTLHSSGGAAMMKAAVAAATEAAEAGGYEKPLILAVTVLTSLDDADLDAVGQSTPASTQVVRLATLAQQCGMDGVVCSAKEIEPIRAACGNEFVLVVPGIRPAGAAHGDQKRVVTPAIAMTSGASCLVVGRPITQADEPSAAAKDILAEIAGAVKAAAE